MKATIDIPDDLYRLLKSRSALEGQTIREITIELYRRWLADHAAPATGPTAEQWLDEWIQLGASELEATPPGPTATEILSKDRDRLEPR